MSVQTITQVLVAASSCDLTDVQTVKDELNITGPNDDEVLARWITSASIDCKNFCNRPFQVETLRDRLFPQRDPLPRTTPGGVAPLQLSRWPIASAASQAGIAAPLSPLLTTVAGGALAARKYFATITYVTSLDETPASVESVVVIAAGRILQVASPPQDQLGLATGYNVYVGTATGKGTLQNVTPIAIGTAWTEPTSGLTTNGASQPNYTAIIENGFPLCEGTDFITDAAVGQLTRLDTFGHPRKWPAVSIVATYQAGYAVVPSEVADAAIRLVKHKWFARGRDPFLRQENIEGVYEAQYWIAQGPGTSGNLPPDVVDVLDNYRVPVTVG